jgi:hypothetical protein
VTDQYLVRGPKRGFLLRWPLDAEHAGEIAEAFVDAHRELQGEELDYSVSTLVQVEAVLDRFRRDAAGAEELLETLVTIGCYVGEVICEAGCGEWDDGYEDGWALRVVSEDGDVLDPLAWVYACVEPGASASLAAAIEAATGLAIGAAEPPEEDEPDPSLPPSLLHAVGLQIGARLLALQAGATAHAAAALRVVGSAVVEDGDVEDPSIWELNPESGVARALVHPPSGDGRGFLTVIATFDVGLIVRCGVPTLPAYEGGPFAVYALQSELEDADTA